jgi:hypothetical protein
MPCPNIRPPVGLSKCENRPPRSAPARRIRIFTMADSRRRKRAGVMRDCPDFLSARQKAGKTLHFGVWWWGKAIPETFYSAPRQVTQQMTTSPSMTTGQRLPPLMLAVRLPTEATTWPRSCIHISSLDARRRQFGYLEMLPDFPNATSHNCFNLSLNRFRQILDIWVHRLKAETCKALRPIVKEIRQTAHAAAAWQRRWLQRKTLFIF